MDQQIRERFRDAIVQEAARRYGVANDRIRPLKAFESFIYEYERGPHAYILRLGHSLRRSEALIQGEVDWINYLAEGGVSVARAIPSETGKLVEAVDDGQGGQFLVTAFAKAQGQSPWDAGWTPALYETYGHLIGSMHALAAHSKPAEMAWKRPDWDDDLFEFVLAVESTVVKAACPSCGQDSADIHSNYMRYPTDLAWSRRSLPTKDPYACRRRSNQDDNGPSNMLGRDWTA